MTVSLRSLRKNLTMIDGGDGGDGGPAGCRMEFDDAADFGDVVGRGCAASMSPSLM